MLFFVKYLFLFSYFGILFLNSSTSLQVAEMTYMLANMFALLYSKGFGTPEGQVDNSGDDTTQDAHGTGMGEGEGVKDVSDQIDDEDQLLGTSEKVTAGTRLVSHFNFVKLLDSSGLLSLYSRTLDVTHLPHHCHAVSVSPVSWIAWAQNSSHMWMLRTD